MAPPFGVALSRLTARVVKVAPPRVDCVRQAGIYWVELMNYYNGGWSVMFTALIETLAFSWVYGMSHVTLQMSRAESTSVQTQTIAQLRTQDLLPKVVEF